MRRWMFLILVLAGIISAGSLAAVAADTAAASGERSFQERLEDIEAYINNGTRVANTNAPGKLGGPGPGHNAWMMTCTALVLFMTEQGTRRRRT